MASEIPDQLSSPAPPSLHPKHIAIPLRLTPHTTLHIQLTQLETSNLIFLTTTDPSNSNALSALGSFVYAMPNRLNPSESISTPLHSVPHSIDFATRVAKILARKTGKPTYVGCSVNLGIGVMVEEEIEAVKKSVEGVMEEISGGVNGVKE
ncbi:MAG: hypothetical protein MMC33_008994 [Icmadophila ericetorum]|nr:hypothetical protein [Icmadophila ericetorum]